jgi:HD superfamily phosphodiesterase
MNNSAVTNTETFVRTTLAGEGTGHDWWHCVRVRNMAVKLAQEEGEENERYATKPRYFSLVTTSKDASG